ncbi:type I polyketide synthase [Teredinibacter turnerae]|uniref:type I polyketide synthase n=1 Tax=Teredinibacter turnerae TaxID=2426 RepID=UPI00041CBC7A|nr:type I polyketide synthase [Teredinibacter turnerae]
MQKATEKTDNRAVLAKALTELKRLQARVKELEAAQTREPIAIIGMSCRFPGGVTTPERLWEYLRGGNNAVQEVPSDRWDLDAFYDPIPGKPGKMYTRRGYFIDEIAGFDRDFFNVGPAEANAMDPQHRLLLETCWEALEYAGLSPTALRGSNTGMFLGAMNSDYAHYSVQDLNAISMYTAITNGNGIAAGRLAHNFGFQGPAIAVDTLCSSSLVSVHLAMRSLQNQECDLALAGGINLLVTPSMFVATCAASMLSTDGLCKTFDESADGYARGEGVGVIALKRLSDAQRDNDSILAVLRGGAVNQDGPSSALPVPNGKAQEKVIRAALKDAGVNPADIGYIEAHGTGTALGDPLEIEALNQVFGADRTAGQPLWLGSIKTNYGHTEGAAGIAGLLKVILALKHGEIPPHLNFSSPSTKVAWDSLPIKVVTEPTRWSEDTPRIAGVSAFGIGGTNAHMVVEAPASIDPDSTQPCASALTLSAKSPEALKAMVDSYADYLASDAVDIANACYTSNISRASLASRLSVYGENADELLAKLRAISVGELPFVAHDSTASNSRLAYLFSGQGSQYPGMGRTLYENQPVFRSAIDRCEELLREQLEVSLTAVLWGEHSDKLNQTQYTQPALFALEYALAEMWSAWGIKPTLVMGHSVGEYVAACYAGLFSLADGLRLIAARGRLMAELCAPGAMSVWFCDAAQVKALVKELGLEQQLAIAAFNSPENTALSGEPDAMGTILAVAEERDIACRSLDVSHAFHSKMLEPMLDAFQAVAESVTYKKPRLRIISNVTGQPAGEELGNALYWVRHTRSAVKFEKGLRALQANNVNVFLEVGPGTGLLSIGKSCLTEASLNWLSSLHSKQPDKPQYIETASRAWELGLPVDWAALHQGRRYHKTVLPFYPFQRHHHWLENAVLHSTPAVLETTAQGESVNTNSSAIKASTTTERPTAQPLSDVVVSIVSAVRGIPPQQIKPEHHFQMDLGYDSMMIMELKSKLEVALNSEEKIPIKEIMMVTTVDKLIEFAQARVAT